MIMQTPSHKLPHLEWIKVFEAAARLGSFTAAARETGLTQPAVSQRIARLEAHFGTRLFLREARTIRLTLEGEAWLPHVQSALTDMSNSAEMLFARSRQHLTLSASQSIITLWLMPRLARIVAATGAAVSVQTLVLGGQNAAPDDMIQIRYGAGGWPHPYQMPLYRDVLSPVAVPALARTDWTAQPRIACSGPRPGWDAFADRHAIPRRPIPTLHFDTFEHALAAAKEGMGVALGSLPLCEAAVSAGDLVRLSDQTIENGETYWLLASKAALTARQWTALSEVLAA